MKTIVNLKNYPDDLFTKKEILWINITLENRPELS